MCPSSLLSPPPLLPRPAGCPCLQSSQRASRAAAREPVPRGARLEPGVEDDLPPPPLFSKPLCWATCEARVGEGSPT